MKPKEFWLYCLNCGSILPWTEDSCEISCDCGESGGIHHEIFVDAHDRTPELYRFTLWGECVPITIDCFDDEARKAFANQTPLFGSEFKITGWIPTKKSKNVLIEWEAREDEDDDDDDEEEFPLATEE